RSAPPPPSSRAADPLDDRRLERLLAQLRYPQPYLASLGLQAALVVASAGIATRLAALIPLRIAQPIRLGIEQGVQRAQRRRWRSATGAWWRCTCLPHWSIS